MSDIASRLTRIESRPLQLPGRDRLVRESVLGGPSSDADARLYLSVEDLERMIEIARASVTGRVVLNRPGIRVRLWERPDGHRFESWTIVAADARAETSSLLSNLRDGIIAP